MRVETNKFQKILITLSMMYIIFCALIMSAQAEQSYIVKIPNADFFAFYTSGDTPFYVKFTDTSTGNPTEWYWEFGDGDTSTQQNPDHTYLDPGRYTVILTVTNDAGSDKKKKSAYIKVTEPATYDDYCTACEDTEDEDTEDEGEVTIITPTPEETPSDLIYAQEYLKKCEREGQIIFQPSEKMTDGKTEIVKAYITRNTSENISKLIEENETLRSRNITVTPRMKATLVGKEDGAFKIQPLTNDIQPIVGERITMWRWEVTPQTYGRLTLILLVDYVISTESDGITSSEVYSTNTIRELEEEIEVKVNPVHTLKNNWKSIIGIIIAILGLPLVNDRISKSKKKE